MTKTDDGIAVVRDVGVTSIEAQNWRRLAEASRPQLREVPEPGKSALEVFGGKAQAAERKATLERLRAKDANQLHPSERAFLKRHAGN